MLAFVTSLIVTSTVLSKGCPDPISIQDPALATEFRLSQFVGEPYYELALHDYTQPKTCGCTRSLKSVSTPDEASYTYLHDNFTQICPWVTDQPNRGRLYISDLSFNFTENAGILHGHWDVTSDLIFPDTVVAVGWPEKAGDPYRWALEMQCVEDNDSIIFVGINFYSRARVGPDAEKNYWEMYNAGLEYGIDEYWGGDDGLRRLDHTGCWYDNKPTPSETEFMF